VSPQVKTNKFIFAGLLSSLSFRIWYFALCSCGCCLRSNHYYWRIRYNNLEI